MIKFLGKLKRKLKKQFFILSNHSNEFKLDIKIEHSWMGNDYGGFPICEKDLSSDSVVFSFGIGEDISFDAALYNKYQSKMYLFDPTPKSIDFIKNSPMRDCFNFQAYGIGKISGKVDFHLPVNPNHVSGSMHDHKNVSKVNTIQVDMKCWNDLCGELNVKKVDVLKIDIEGAEYDVLDEILNSSINVKQILIEFHSRYYENGEELTRSAIKLIKEKGYKLFSISDTLEEFAFIKY